MLKINPISCLFILAFLYAPLQSFCKGDGGPDKFDASSAVIRKSTCGRSNGAVLHVKMPANVSWTWKDKNGVIVSADTNLLNVSSGSYDLQINYQVTSETETVRFEIGQLAAPVFTENFSITQADCGMRTGSIAYKGIADPAFTYSWVNDKHQLITPLTSVSSPISNLSQGFYSLRVSLAVDSACFTYSSPIELSNLSGPYFDLSQVKITNATCRMSNGIIRSVYVRNTLGSFFCQWEDSTGTVLSKTIDLFGVPKGKYHMKFKDASNCDTLVTPYFVVDGLGYITIDSSALKIRPSDCTNAKGSISGIRVDNATSFEWLDINTGAIAGNAADLMSRASGKYQLLTSNGTCALATKIINIGKAGFEPIKVVSANATDAHCDDANGSMNAIQFERNPFAYRFEWKNPAGNSISNTPLFSKVAAGTYRLIATDSNQCNGEVYAHEIKLFPKPVINYDKVTTVADSCSFKTGSISGITATGGGGSYSWTWSTSNSNAFAATKDIHSLQAGLYSPVVADSFNCRVQGKSIQVSKQSLTWPVPFADDVEVLKGNSANIQVKNPLPGLYQLYDNNSGSNRLSLSYDGNFRTPGVSENKHFYIRYDSGSCSSPMKDVLVKVIVQKDVMVPNGFSPNQDGHNDSFKPIFSRQTEKYVFTVYSRWGKKIFETNELNKGWNGLMDQLPADPGSYVWTCSYQLPGEAMQTLKGTVTLVR